MTEVEKTVNALLKKAALTNQAHEAMQFAQAALNAAHVKHALAKHP